MKKRKMILLLCVVVLLLIGICVGAAVGLFGDEPAEPAVKSKNPMGLPQDLIDALTEYLITIDHNVNLKVITISDALDSFSSENQGLHVTFDPSDYYYVCAYYNPSHKKEDWPGNWPDEYEFWAYCCVAEYTWVRFDSEKDIMESYDNKQFIVAFQINPAYTCRDVVSETAEVPEFVHQQIYEPEFKDGVNIAQPIVFNDTFIYINRFPQASTVYYKQHHWDHYLLKLPCISLEDDYYIRFHMYTCQPSGEHNASDLQYELGAYYEDIMQVAVTDKYSITTDYGAVRYYGLIDIEEIPNLLKNQEGGN